jgi:hypothetical protein
MKSDQFSDLTILATYWNEIEWINASLAQIDSINPKKVIICDGCFDPKHVNSSTDGTSEIIREFAKNKEHVMVINAIRISKIGHIINWFKYKKHGKLISFQDVYELLRIMKTNIYRINQMTTFQYMLTEVAKVSSGDWFMTYDCDQFYSDEIILKLHNINQYKDFNILTCKELTFFHNFETYTDEYDKRDYNNMPHKYLDGLRFIATRNPARVKGYRYTNCSDFDTQKKFIGQVYHYKIKNPDRLIAGYNLGNRKAPSPSNYINKPFNQSHPRIITSFLRSKI